MQTRYQPGNPPQHARKISYHDMAVTYRNAGPIMQPPHQASANGPQMMTTPALQEQARQEAIRRAVVKRHSQKPTDRHIPDELANVVVGDGVHRYEQLRDAERRLDALMMRKRLDVKDNAQRSYSKREGTLRVWISNTAEGQPWQMMEDGSGMNADGTFDFDTDQNGSTYRVKIEGRLIEDEVDADEENKAPPPKFSSFFKSIVFEFQRNDPAREPFSPIVWRKQYPTPQMPNVDLTSKANNFDSLEFERKGDDALDITISLIRDLKQDRFRLSPPLADLLDTEEDDVPGIVQGIWEYARAMNLQEDDDKRTITCDEALQRVFNTPKIGFPYLPELLQAHIQPIPPIQLKYTARMDKAYIAPSDSTPPSQPTIYDIRVPLPNTFVPVLTKFYNSKTHIDSLKSIIDMDSDIALLVAKINQTNAKRKFYENLSKDPAGFVKRWIGSQKRDLEVILVEATRGGGEDGEQWRKGGEDGVWGSDIAKESVGLWLARSGRF